MHDQINDLQRESASRDEGSTVENYKGRERPCCWLERAETQLALSHAWRDPEWGQVSRGGLE